MLCFKDVGKVVAETLNIETKDIMPNNSFDDLGFDYLTYKKLSSLIYSHFNIKISPENLNTFKRIRDLYTYIDCCVLLKK